MLNRNIQPQASIEDIVNVDGYGNRVFRVDGYSVEFHYEKDHEYSEVIYDLTCPFTFEFIVAGESEVTIVCKAEQGDAYLTQIEPHSPVSPPTDYVMPFPFKLDVITPADVRDTKPKRKTQRQKQAEVDGLLDELITLQTVIDICGDDADYAVRIADVKRKLGEATA